MSAFTSVKKVLQNLPSVLHPTLKYFILAKLCIQNILAGKKKDNVTNWVCTLGEFKPEDRVGYAWEVFNDYLEYSKLSSAELVGKHILEIGPGEHFGVAILFLAHGAAKVTCVDRFPSLLPNSEQAQVYKQLKGQLQDKGIDTSGFLSFTDNDYVIPASRLQYIAHTPLEMLGAKLPDVSVDIIISRAVLEHIFDMDAGFASMDKLLKAGGKLIHEVDFRDHGIFSTYNLHPLTLLTVSDSMWRKVTSNLGAPNRKLAPYFRKMLESRGYAYDMLNILAVGSDHKFHEHQLTLGITHQELQEQSVEAIRHRLQPEYKTLPLEDLLASGIFFTATKK
jgi:SAM-dependent methyltransferase